MWAIDLRSEKFRTERNLILIIQGSRGKVESFESMNKPREERDGEKVVTKDVSDLKVVMRINSFKYVNYIHFIILK